MAMVRLSRRASGLASAAVAAAEEFGFYFRQQGVGIERRFCLFGLLKQLRREFEAADGALEDFCLQASERLPL